MQTALQSCRKAKPKWTKLNKTGKDQAGLKGRLHVEFVSLSFTLKYRLDT